MVRKTNVDETGEPTSSTTPENVTVLEGIEKFNVSFQYRAKKSVELRNRVSKMDGVVRQLENSLLESQQNDRQLLLTVQRDDVRTQKLAYQLEQARKENKQLLNVLQKQNNDETLSRPSSRSQSDVSSYSTMSMVHLQYKYEELLSSYEGLLKVLETKARECQKCYRENEEHCDEVQNLSLQLANSHKTINTLCEKYLSLKQRKDSKIATLRYERDTLRLAHNQVVSLLHKKCMDDDFVMGEELQRSVEPTRSLLITEIRRTNKLQHENARLQQENTFLKYHLNAAALKDAKCPCNSAVTNSDE